MTRAQNPTPLTQIRAAACLLGTTLGAHADSASEAAHAQIAELRAAAAAGPASGHDGSAFFVGSEDGAYKLKVGGQIQFRYVLNYRDEPTNTDEDVTNGFQTRRTRLEFAGNAFGKETTYLVQTDFRRTAHRSWGGVRASGCCRMPRMARWRRGSSSSCSSESRHGTPPLFRRA